ncbi:MAG: FCD domain-containing protein [Beijerinckiaceae bacterium]
MSLALNDITGDAGTARTVASIELAIATAALVPGQTYKKSRVAALSGVFDGDLDDALSVLASDGYLSFSDDQVTICPLDIDAALQSLDKICALEIHVVSLAIQQMTDQQRVQLQLLMQATHRAALIGDIPAILASDRSIEALIGQASGSPAKAAELVKMKRELKRAWCHTHRFRNVNHFVDIRGQMVQAINTGEVDVATDLIRQFFALLPIELRKL